MKRCENLFHGIKDLLAHDTIVASLSHELRTPITAIKGSIDLLKRGVYGNLTTGQGELLRASNIALDRLLNQVDQLLDFAELENGHVNLQIADAFIDEIIMEALQMIQALFEQKNQSIQTYFECHAKVKVDRTRIRQVMGNLLSNAHKFSLEGGIIKIKSYTRGAYVIVEVHDYGIGIPTEKQDCIFNRFYQINPNIGGTGLGLAISKQLLEKHGGRIWVNSDEATGTVFTFILPLVVREGT